ncbi:MAG: HNH endonuclease signature motif containing protein [Nanoarchaeota archaeon]
MVCTFACRANRTSSILVLGIYIKIDKKKAKQRLLKRIEKVKSGCWIWKRSKTDVGYGHLTFDGIYYSAHRFSYIIYKGEIPKGLFVLHKCDNRLCVNPKHLFVGNQSDNMKDCYIKNRHARISVLGQEAWNSKLKDKDVVKIKKLYKMGLIQKKIAEMFNVDRSLISRVINNKRWKHIVIIPQ